MTTILDHTHAQYHASFQAQIIRHTCPVSSNEERNQATCTANKSRKIEK